MAGRRGDEHSFLLLIDTFGSAAIVDPEKHNGVTATESSRAAAGLRAQALFSGAGATGGANVGVLAANLEKGAPGGPYEWSFFRVRPELALYAPVLQFGPAENVFPADVNIWDALNKAGNGKSQAEYERAYAALGDERWKRCTVYYRTRSYGGSWLVEYCYYYPFDEGHPN